MSYLLRLLDKTDPTASLKHAAYALVIVAGCTWLTIALYRPTGLDANWVAAFGLLLAAVTTGKVLGKTVGLVGPTAPGGPRVVPTPQADTDGGPDA